MIDVLESLAARGFGIKPSPEENRPMQRMSVTLAVLLVCAVMPALAQAQNADKAKKKRRGNPGFRKRILERFDKDGDGKLSAEERAAARKAREQFQARRMGQGKGKKRGNARRRGNNNRRRRPNTGRRPGGDRPNAQQGLNRLRRAIMVYFDRNRNGKLDPPERERLMQFISRGRPGRPGAGDRPNGRRRPGADGKRRRPGADGKKRRRRPGADAFQADGAGDRPGVLDKKALIKKYDTNGDGKIDANERRKALRDRKKAKKG